MDLRGFVQNPVFIFVTGALGGLFGTLLKGRVDIWTSDAKRRQDSGTHFFQQIEVLAPSYYLMSNYAYLLSWHLDSYLQMKRELQMSLLDPEQPTYKQLKQYADDTAAQALFEAGKLYRVITDRFFTIGGDYVVPDQWANKSLNGLHDKIMGLLSVDTNVLLNHIDAKTERQEFLAKLQGPEWDHRYDDLRQLYSRYQDWVLKQDKDVKLLAVAARAYSDLFSLQMKRLYQDVWNRTADDPLVAAEVTGQTAGLSDSTRKLIQRAAQENDRLTTRLSDFFKEDESDALLSLGWSYYEAQRWDLALGEFNKAIAKCPSSAVAHNSLGNVYTNLKQWDKAAAEYARASELDPDNPLFKHNYGRMQSLRSEPEHLETAVSLFRESIKLGSVTEPPNDSQQALRYNDLGLALSSLELKRWEEAIAAFGEAIALQPLDPVLYANLALAYESLYDSQIESGTREAAPGGSKPDFAMLSAAGDEYSMAARLSTGDAAAKYERSTASTFRKAQRWKEAAATYQSALEHAASDAEKVETYYQFGRMYEEQKDWNQAVRFYATALQLGGNKNSLHADSLVYALQQSENPFPPDLTNQAIEACVAAINADPNELAHHERLSSIFYRLGNYPRFLDERDYIVGKALVRWSEGQIDAQRMAAYCNQLGLAYRRLEIWDMAVDYYKKAIGLHAAPEYQKNLGLLLQARSYYDQAREPLEAARKGLKDDLDVDLSLVQVLAYGSKPDLPSAIGLCREAISGHPGNAGSHFLLAELLLAQKDFVEAAAEYQRAVGLTTDEKQRAGWLRKAVGAYDLALQEDPGRVDIQFGRGSMLFQVGEYIEAEKAFKKALELAGDRRLESISIQNGLAQLYYRLEDWASAQSAWEKALQIAAQLQPEERAKLASAPLGRIDLEQITNNLGTAYDAQGEKDKALDRYREAAANSPNTFVAHYNLAKGLYLQKQFGMALGQFQEALRLRPPDALYRKTVHWIGNCFFRLDCTDLASEKWNEVAQPGFDLPEAYFNLGVWSWLNGQDDEAGKRWESALKASPALREADYNLGILSLKRGNIGDAIDRWKKIAGQKGFESLQVTIDAVQKGEKPSLEIKDILGV